MHDKLRAIVPDNEGKGNHQLQKMGFSNTTFYSIKAGNSMNTNTLDTLCKLLDCSVPDILEYVKDEDDSNGEDQ